jgi:hypothetical protein
LHALHACFVALIDDGDQEIHEDNISTEHQEHIGRPSHKFVLRLLNVEGAFSPDDAERHDDEAERPETLTIGIRVIKNDHKDDAEGRNHHDVVREEETKVIEHSLDHLYQETEGIKNLKRLIDLHESQQDQHYVHKSPLILKTNTIMDENEWKVCAEIEHDEGKICNIP